MLAVAQWSSGEQKFAAQRRQARLLRVFEFQTLDTEAVVQWRSGAVVNQSSQLSAAQA